MGFSYFFEIGFLKLFLIPFFFGRVLRKVRLNVSPTDIVPLSCKKYNSECAVVFECIECAVLVGIIKN